MINVVKRRAAFALVLLVLGALLFCFSAPHLLWMLAVLVGAEAALVLLLRVDARRFALELRLSPGGQVGQPMKGVLSVRCRGPVLAAAALVVTLEVDHVMFGVSRQKTLRIPINRRAMELSFEFPTELCGEARVRCTAAHLWDLLGLSRARCTPFREVRTVRSPRAMPVQLTLARSVVNTAQEEGLTQNRRGGDLSETFDLRAYVPGDDVRAIHWKLSSKSEDLILRQASEPFHYDVVLLPDLGLSRAGEAVSFSELNGAVALTAALGEQLLRQGVSFCLALPGREGLLLHEVRTLRALHNVLPQWFSLELPARSGAGLHYFLSQHLEQSFTRLILISAGPYAHDVSRLGRTLAAAVLCTDDTVEEPVYLPLGPFCENVTLPAEPGEKTVRLVC